MQKSDEEIGVARLMNFKGVGLLFGRYVLLYISVKTRNLAFLFNEVAESFHNFLYRNRMRENILEFVRIEPYREFTFFACLYFPAI